MGNYLFNRKALLEELHADARDASSMHDFGRDILPRIVGTRAVFAYDFRQNRVPGMAPGEDNSYWRDVGTLDCFWEAHMDLRATQPVFNLYNEEWPVRTADFWNPPAKFVHEAEDRIGRAVNSLVSDGCIVSGGVVRGSVLGRRVHVHSYSEITDSVLLDHVDVGRGARIRRAVIDEYSQVPPGTVIGYNHDEDRRRFAVSDHGIVVVTPDDFTREPAHVPQPVGV